MKIDFSFMEVVAKPSTTNFFKHSLEDLSKSMDKSAIHTFGWPIAAVLHNSKESPKPISNGIESKFEHKGHREFWRLMRTGEFYFIGELFENNRKTDSIFLDTRVHRITETLLRIGRLFKELGVEDNEEISIIIKHGNLKNKILAAANPARVFFIKRKCNVNEVSSNIKICLKDIFNPEDLKEIVYSIVRELAEMFDMFNPDKAFFTDPIVDAFLKGKII